ncbi:MAG: hypothetical protein AAF649_09940 [Verrucomicrobiota bacterium]
MNAARLQQEKQLLIRQCEQDRQKLYDCFEELEEKTGWTQLAVAGASVMAPKLKLILPVVELLLPKLLASTAAQDATSGVKQVVSTALALMQRLRTVSKGLKVLPGLLPARFK